MSTVPSCAINDTIACPYEAGPAPQGIDDLQIVQQVERATPLEAATKQKLKGFSRFQKRLLRFVEDFHGFSELFLQFAWG